VLMGSRLSILVMAIAVGSAGCSPYQPVMPPKVLRNHHPVDLYRVLLTIPELPGVMRFTATATYGISNKTKCVPIDRRRPLGGSRPSFRETITIPVVARSEHEFEVLFYNVAMLSEDYYGLGACEWRGSPMKVISASTVTTPPRAPHIDASR